MCERQATQVGLLVPSQSSPFLYFDFPAMLERVFAPFQVRSIAQLILHTGRRFVPVLQQAAPIRGIAWVARFPVSSLVDTECRPGIVCQAFHVVIRVGFFRRYGIAREITVEYPSFDGV